MLCNNMVGYDYTRDVKEVENRIDWLKESYIGAQQHGCFKLAEMIRSWKKPRSI